jgi:terminase small subunit-like protein
VGGRKKMNQKVGRPSIYSSELAKRICEIVSSNPYGIRKLVRMYPELPDEATINIWRHHHPEFFADYVKAREQQAHLLFECAIDELEELEQFMYDNPDNGAKEINAGVVAMKKAIANQKSRQAAILNRNYRLDKTNEESNNPLESANKVRDLVNELNKTNSSDI